MASRTYIYGSYGDHVGAVEFQPHLLHSFPERSTVLWTLPVHLQDVQASREHLGLSLQRSNTHTHTLRCKTTAETMLATLIKQPKAPENKNVILHRGDDEAPAALIHLQLLHTDAELCEEI